MPTRTYLKPVILLTAVFLCVFTALAHAVPRILVVGDSWAQGIWVGGLMDRALETAGFKGVTSVGESLALGGTRAEQWTRPEYKQRIADALAEHPTVDIIHLVIGGNDVLRHIKERNVFETWSEGKRTREWDVIARNIEQIVAYCLAFPQVHHIGLAGYDYINAATAREVFAILGQQFHFGDMTQAQVNECFIELERRKRDIGLRTEGCTYLHNLGLLQHHFNDPPGAPRPGAAPHYLPFPGGRPDHPMPDAAFIKVTFEGREFAGDGIHPNDESHLIMLENAIRRCYRHLLAEEPVRIGIGGCRGWERILFCGQSFFP